MLLEMSVIDRNAPVERDKKSAAILLKPFKWLCSKSMLSS